MLTNFLRGGILQTIYGGYTMTDSKKKFNTLIKISCLGIAALTANATSGCIGPAESYIIGPADEKTRYVPVPVFLPIPFFFHHHCCHAPEPVSSVETAPLKNKDKGSIDSLFMQQKIKEHGRA